LSPLGLHHAGWLLCRGEQQALSEPRRYRVVSKDLRDATVAVRLSFIIGIKEIGIRGCRWRGELDVR